MESKTASALHLELKPVALIWADEKPEGAMEFAPGKWGCVMFHLAAAEASKRRREQQARERAGKARAALVTT